MIRKKLEAENISTIKSQWLTTYFANYGSDSFELKDNMATIKAEMFEEVEVLRV